MAIRWGFVHRGKARLLAAGAVALVLVACDPIPHPQYVAREGPTSPVTFELLSGDGRFVVVRSTGASATVPAAGRWRIDRGDGSLAPLPGGDRGTKISRDGSRVLVTTGASAHLWSNSTSLSPPTGAQFSDDLTFGVFVDTDGAVKTWEAATQAVGLVQTGFPRPPGTTSAIPKGVSDDGRTVQYTLFGTQRLERFVDLDAAQVLDRPNLDGTGSGTGYVTDRFVLAADGSAFAQAHEEGHFDVDSLSTVVEISWAELVALPSGPVQRRYTNTTQESLRRVLISVNGEMAWTYQERQAPDGAQGCPPSPAAEFCVVDSQAVVFWGPSGLRQFDTGPGALGAIDISAHGRFLLLDKEVVSLYGQAPKGPVGVLDAFASVEALGQAEMYLETTDSVKCRVFGHPGAPCTIPAHSTGGQVSDDMRVVATTTNTGEGWYEYTASP